jgi:hypothetical protein
MDSEFAEALRGSFAAKGQVWSAVIVLMLPLVKKPVKLLGRLEGEPAIKFIIVRPETPLYLSVGFRAPRGVPSVRNTKIVQMPREVSAEFGAIVEHEDIRACEGDTGSARSIPSRVHHDTREGEPWRKTSAALLMMMC